MKPLIKLFTGLGALIMLLIGVGILAITIYGFVNSSIFLGDANTKNMVLYIMLGVSIAIIAGSAEGLYGICKEKPRMICAFQIIVIIFMIIFIGVGFGLVYLPNAFFNGDCQTSTNTVITYANNIYNQSITNYCITCACALDVTTYDSNDQAIISGKYSNISVATGAHTTADCIKASLSEPEQALFATIGEL